VKGAARALIVIALGGCSQPPQVVAASQLAAQTHVLNGKTVRVSGYLGNCSAYDCVLFADKAGYDAARRYIDALQQKKSPTEEFPPAIGIGGFPDFDRKAEPFQNGMVTITGVVTDKCRAPDNKSVCTDRSPDLEPTDIVSLKDK